MKSKLVIVIKMAVNASANNAFVMNTSASGNFNHVVSGGSTPQAKTYGYKPKLTKTVFP